MDNRNNQGMISQPFSMVMSYVNKFFGNISMVVDPNRELTFLSYQMGNQIIVNRVIPAFLSDGRTELQFFEVARLPETCIGTPSIGYMQQGLDGESPVVVMAWTDLNHRINYEYLSIDFYSTELNYVDYP